MPYFTLFPSVVLGRQSCKQAHQACTWSTIRSFTGNAQSRRGVPRLLYSLLLGKPWHLSCRTNKFGRKDSGRGWNLEILSPGIEPGISRSAAGITTAAPRCNRVKSMSTIAWVPARANLFFSTKTNSMRCFVTPVAGWNLFWKKVWFLEDTLGLWCLIYPGGGAPLW